MKPDGQTPIAAIDISKIKAPVRIRSLIEPEASDADIITAYQTLRGEQRRSFFHQHAEALIRAHRSSSASA